MVNLRPHRVEIGPSASKPGAEVDACLMVRQNRFLPVAATRWMGTGRVCTHAIGFPPPDRAAQECEPKRPERRRLLAVLAGTVPARCGLVEGDVVAKDAELLCHLPRVAGMNPSSPRLVASRIGG